MRKPILNFRHGEPVKEFTKCCRGSGSDCDLSQEGLWQTERNIDFIVNRFGRDIRDVLVVTPSLIRTHTFGKLLREAGAVHEIHDALKAIHAGDWEGMPWDEIKQRWPEQFENCTKDGDKLVVPGGEEISVLKERVLGAWQHWIHQECAALIIVSHDSPNGIINQHVEGHPKLNLRGQSVGGMHEYTMDSDGNVQVVARDVLPYSLYEAPPTPVELYV